MKTLKFEILKDQQSSVYEDNGIYVRIEYNKWQEWEEYNYQNFKKWQKDSECNLPSFDVDECRECQILSREHLDSYLNYTLGKK